MVIAPSLLMESIQIFTFASTYQNLHVMFRSKFWVFIFLWGQFHISTFAQPNRRADSIFRVYLSHPQDTMRILALSQLAFEVNDKRPDSTVTLANEVLEKSKQLDFATGIALGYLRLGLGLNSLGRYPEALDSYYQAMTVYHTQGNERGQAAVLNNMAVTYSNLGNFPMSLSSSLECLALREKLQLRNGVAMSNLNIGQTYLKLRKDTLALEHLAKSLRMFEELKDSVAVAGALISLGVAHQSLGDYKNAWLFQTRGLQLSRKVKDRLRESYALNNLGDILYQQGRYAEAIAYFEQSIEIKRQRQDIWGLCYSLNGLALAYQKLGDYDQSTRFAKMGLFESERIKAPLESKMLNETLAETSRRNGNYRDAFLYSDIAHRISDSLFTLEKSKAIANMEIYAKLREKDRQLLQIEQEREMAEKQKQYNSIIAALGFLCFSVVSVFTFFVVSNLKKVRQQKLQIEDLNKNLEHTVQQRTAALNERNQQLEQYAFFNSHRLRSPVSRILGLCNLLKISKKESEWRDVLPRLNEAARELDHVVFTIQRLVEDRGMKSGSGN